MHSGKLLTWSTLTVQKAWTGIFIFPVAVFFWLFFAFDFHSAHCNHFTTVALNSGRTQFFNATNIRNMMSLALHGEPSMMGSQYSTLQGGAGGLARSLWFRDQCFENHRFAHFFRHQHMLDSGKYQAHVNNKMWENSHKNWIVILKKNLKRANSWKISCF